MAFTLRFEGPPSKCNTCSRSQIMDMKNDRKVWCHSLEHYVPPIEQCSMYTRKGEMDMWEMKEQAWILEVKKGKTIGFLSPMDAKKKHMGTTDDPF